MRESSVAIIGAGVIGLTTGIEAQRAGIKSVHIYAEKPPLETTSAKAGAVFEPYRPGNMSTQEMLLFTSVGLKRYGEIIDAHPESETGIRPHDLYSTSTGQIDPEEVPFLPAIPRWRLLGEEEAPGEYRSALLLEEVPFIDPTYALPWLTDEFVKNGGEIKRPYEKITDLAEFVENTPESVVFNCSGLGAKDLLNDREIHPMRGQIVVVGKTPEWDHSVLGDDGYYLFPRMQETVLGGTTELDVDEEVAELETVELILKRAQVLWPEISADDIKRTYGGLRPFRESGADISAQYMGNKLHIRSVGFGGSGWTFAWGAAEKAIGLLEQGHQSEAA